MTTGLIMVSANLFAVTFTAIQNGNWSSAATWGGTAPSFNVLADDVVIPSGINVTLDGDLVLDGLLAQLNVNGQINASGNESITLNDGLLTGSGQINVHSFEFGSSSNSSFNGTMNTDILVSNSITLLLNSNTTVNETLHMEGGDISISNGKTLTVGSGAMIIAEGGNIQGQGAFVASGTFDVLYNGSGMDSGKELTASTLNELTIDLNSSADEVELNNDITVNGMLLLSSGYMDLNGNKLILEGDFQIDGTASLRSNGNSSIYVYSSSSLSNDLEFDPGSNDIEQVVIEFDNASGAASFGSDVRITSELRLSKGDFTMTSGNTATFANNATIWVNDGSINMMGTSNFDAEGAVRLKYTGSSKTTGVEISGGSVSDFELELSDNNQSLTINDDMIIDDSATFEGGWLNMNNHDVVFEGHVSGSGNVMINGDENSGLWLNGTFASSTMIQFQSTDTVSALVMDMDNAGSVEIDGDLYVMDSARFDRGVVLLVDNTLTIDGSATTEGGDEDSYVQTSGIAELVMSVNGSNSENVEFPLGDSDGFAPVRIQNGAANNVQFRVKQYSVVYSGGTTGYALNNSEAVVNKTWDIAAEGTNTYDLSLEMQWMSNMEVNGFDRTDAFISHYVNGSWDTYATTSAQAAGSGSYKLSRTGITSLSPFSVQNDGVTGAPVLAAQTGLNIYPNPVKNVLSIEGDQQYDLITVYDLSGKVIHFEHVVGVTNLHQVDLSSLKEGMYVLSLSNNGNVVATERIVKL